MNDACMHHLICSEYSYLAAVVQTLTFKGKIPWVSYSYSYTWERFTLAIASYHELATHGKVLSKPYHGYNMELIYVNYNRFTMQHAADCIYTPAWDGFTSKLIYICIFIEI